MAKRYYDIIHARPDTESRTAEEIIKEIEKNTGIKAVKK